MLKYNWLDNTLGRRILWYENSLSSLANFLELKEPYEPKEVAEFMMGLASIRDRINIDNELAKSPTKPTNKDVEKYFQMIMSMLEALPTPYDNPNTWIAKLYDAHGILYKHFSSKKIRELE